MVKDVMLETADQSSDSFSACPISPFCCPKHHTVEQRRGSWDLTVIQPNQNIPETRIPDFRITVKKFTLAEEDMVTNRR